MLEAPLKGQQSKRKRKRKREIKLLWLDCNLQLECAGPGATYNLFRYIHAYLHNIITSILETHHHHVLHLIHSNLGFQSCLLHSMDVRLGLSLSIHQMPTIRKRKERERERCGEGNSNFVNFSLTGFGLGPKGYTLELVGESSPRTGLSLGEQTL